MKPLSVIIPAMNEENYLGATLKSLGAAAEALQSGHGCAVQVIVVDNQSTDQTACIARGLGAIVVPEPVRNIARARNTGARVAEGELLFFLDADTLVPPSVLTRVSSVMSYSSCAGGAVHVLHRPARALLRMYVGLYGVLGRLSGMAQGAAQFWRREPYFTVGGYDETMYFGEDVDFYWRMSRAARRAGRKVCYVSDVQVVPSPRRYDQWPLWKTLW
jgi:glycosyltransferase involved in cell wall biosynthesis